MPPYNRQAGQSPVVGPIKFIHPYLSFLFAHASSLAHSFSLTRKTRVSKVMPEKRMKQESRYESKTSHMARKRAGDREDIGLQERGREDSRIFVSGTLGRGT